MLCGLVGLSWLDIVSVILTFATVVLVQLLNAYLLAKTPTTVSAEKQIPSTSTAETSSPQQQQQQQQTQTQQHQEHPETIGKLQKQKSTALSEDSSTSVNSSPPSSFRNSISSLNNGCISHPLGSDSLSDEYHEDEDTLSLDNLFPCDQSEIYASKKISFIIDELMQTEENYVNNLRKGIVNYGNISGRQDLPATLQGEDKRSELLGNIEEIIELHERHILPMMLRNQRDLKQLFDEFAGYFDNNQFYCYVVFTMNKKESMQLRQDNREWFTTLQSELNDKLGIDSFLVQPIQRMTRYPLLLQQFISEFYKSGISCKPVLMSVCKLETRMRRFLEVVNQAEEVHSIDELSDINILSQGNFRRYTELDAYQHRLRKKYRAKVFLFDHCLLCTEVRKKRLAYRCHYAWESLELLPNTSKHVTVSTKVRKTISMSSEGADQQLKEELELYALDVSSMTQWLRCARKINDQARVAAAGRGKFSLPMDLVLGVLLAIWLIWRYLY